MRRFMRPWIALAVVSRPVRPAGCRHQLGAPEAEVANPAVAACLGAGGRRRARRLNRGC